MSENNGHIHVSSPGAESEYPLVSEFFHLYKSSVILVVCCKLFHSHDCITVFPIHGDHDSQI